MAGIRIKLAAAGDADIGPPIVDDGRRGAHGDSGCAVLQLERLLRGDLPPCCVQLDLDELAALAGRVVGLGAAIIADGAAHVAADAAHFVQQRTRGRVEQQHAAGRQHRRGQVLAVVRAHEEDAVLDACARPVEAAGLHVPPGGIFFFIAGSWPLVRDGDTDEAGVAGFVVPEAGVGIAV